jgi:hypothetical protein
MVGTIAGGTGIAARRVRTAEGATRTAAGRVYTTSGGHWDNCWCSNRGSINLVMPCEWQGPGGGQLGSRSGRKWPCVGGQDPSASHGGAVGGQDPSASHGGAVGGQDPSASHGGTVGSRDCSVGGRGRTTRGRYCKLGSQGGRWDGWDRCRGDQDSCWKGRRPLGRRPGWKLGGTGQQQG